MASRVLNKPQSRRVADLEALRAERAMNLRQLLLRAHRALNARIATKLVMRGHTVRPTQIALFSSIDFQGTRVSTLAERANVTQQAMGQLAIELEQLGYVRREVDPQDRRATVVVFTDEGWKLMLDSIEALREVERECEAALGDREMGMLRATLQKLAEYLQMDYEAHASGRPAVGKRAIPKRGTVRQNHD